MKKLVLALCSIFLSAQIFALEWVSPFEMPSAKSHATGGTHAAWNEDMNVLFVNPAGMTTVKEFGVVDMAFSTTGPIFEILGAMGDFTGGDTDSMLKSIKKIAKNGNLPLGFDFRFPLASGVVKGDSKSGWGFAVWDRLYADAQVKGGTTMNADANGELVAIGGYAYRFDLPLDMAVDVGATLKLAFREHADMRNVSLDLGGDFDIFDNFHWHHIFGGGLSVGATYSLFANRLRFALVVNDLISPVGIMDADSGDLSFGMIEPMVNTGVGWTIYDGKLGGKVPFAANLALDYRDWVNLFQQGDYTSRNAWLNLGFGGEVKFFDIIALRLGMNEMLPALGIGINAKALRIETSLYGKEVGREPGIMSTYGFDMSLLFRYPAKTKAEKAEAKAAKAEKKAAKIRGK